MYPFKCFSFLYRCPWVGAMFMTRIILICDFPLATMPWNLEKPHCKSDNYLSLIIFGSSRTFILLTISEFVEPQLAC